MTPTPAHQPTPASETPETDAMTRLYREQVAPVLDTLAAGACTRILNKMGQIERELAQALAKLAAPVEGESPETEKAAFQYDGYDPESFVVSYDLARRLEIERNQALANYRFMVERAADQKLDGYRELGQRAANAENEAAALRAKLAAPVEGEVVAWMDPDGDVAVSIPDKARNPDIYFDCTIPLIRAPKGDNKKEGSDE